MTPHGYQQGAINHLTEVIRTRGSAVDGSDCGVGKTLVGVEVMKNLGLPTLVVCPKPVIPGWHRHAALQGTELDAINWEMVRTGRTPYGEWRLPSARHRIPRFYWNPAIKFLMFDEVHRAMTYTSKNAAMLRAARKQRIPVLAMSATVADTPLELDALGYVLGLHEGDNPPTLRNPNPVDFLSWARKRNCRPGLNHEFEFFGTPEEKRTVMASIHKEIYPSHGTRVRIADLGDAFPETQICAELYDLGDADRVNRLYAEMAEQLAILEERKLDDCDTPMVRLLRARQEIELIKVPVMEELARDYHRQGMHVCLFVNFSASVKALCERLQTDCFIDGSQVGAAGAARRAENNRRFQSDESPWIVANSEAGGLGLDFHDVRGEFPRASLISAGYNAKTLRQVFGRPQRSGGKSKSIQRVILARGTVEEGVHYSINTKSNNLDALNDGDLQP